VILLTGSYSGWQTKRPAIYTDINSQVTYVQIKANIVAPVPADPPIDPPIYVTYPIDIDPWNLCFHPEDPLSIDPIEFEITNLTSLPLTLTQLSWPDTLVEFTLPEEIPGGGTVIASVRADEETYVPSIRKSVTFVLSDVFSTRFTVPVTSPTSLPDLVDPCVDDIESH